MSSSNSDLARGTGSNTNNPRANEAICELTIYFTSGGEWTPWSIPVFVLANFATFATAAMHFNLCLGGRSRSRDSGGCKVRSWWQISPTILDKMGAVEWYKVVCQNQGWRLITAMWSHAYIVHILLNNSILAVFGFGLEQRFVRMGTIYLLSGFGGSILCLLFIQDGMAVGASCAIYGVIGAMILKLISNWTLHANKFDKVTKPISPSAKSSILSLTRGAGLFILIGAAALGLGLGAFTSDVDNFCHIGGLLTGFLLGIVLLVRPQHGWVNSQDRSDDAHANKPKYDRYQYMLWLLGLALSIIEFTVGWVMLYKSPRTITAVGAII